MSVTPPQQRLSGKRKAPKRRQWRMQQGAFEEAAGELRARASKATFAATVFAHQIESGNRYWQAFLYTVRADSVCRKLAMKPVKGAALAFLGVPKGAVLSERIAPFEKGRCLYTLFPYINRSHLSISRKIFDFAGPRDLMEAGGSESRLFQGFACVKTLVRRLRSGALRTACFEHLCALQSVTLSSHT